MKRVLLTLLAVIVVLGLFVATGYMGYRLGFAHGIQVAANGNNAQPGARLFDDFGPRGMPMHRFGYQRGWGGPGGFPMMGFGFFGPLMFLGRIVVLALIIWFIYWLFTRSGWHLTRTTQVVTPPPPSVENREQSTDVNP